MVQMYEWKVELYGAEIYVKAVDKLAASKEAARKAGVSWKGTARDMVFTKLRRC